MIKLIKKIQRLISVILKWIPPRLGGIGSRRTRPVHILFCMVDHFEPGTENAGADVERARVKELLTRYPELADKHRDFAGNIPKRTWFFPPHYHRNNSLRDLTWLCEKGYGEIELHLHHGKIVPDTSENLEATIKQCIREYSLFGIFGIENGRKRYGFIHGDWALDNSRGGRFCGVNNEIDILKKTGCYADFTFPSSHESNPDRINSIYYAKDNPLKPKSYNTGIPVEKGSSPSDDLIMIQGPLYPFFMGGGFSGLRIFGDSITGSPPVTDRRIDAWVRTGIHVKGKKDWIIIKTHTHGASSDSEAVLGREMDDIFTYLETAYNDGSHYHLHYVTARELYNIIKAVEAGEPGENPEAYRDYKIRPPVYDSSPDLPGASETLKNLVQKTYMG